MSLSRASLIKRSRFIGTWKVRSQLLCVIFKLKGVLSALLLTTYTSNNLHNITYHENNVQSPFRTYPIIALHEHWAIFHAPELYSTQQIPFCQIILRSIARHSPVNNLHFITYFTHSGQNSDRQKTNRGAIFEIWSSSLARYIFTYSRLQYVFG